MTTRILITGVACLALMSVAACNRQAATTDDYATAADDTAVDAVAVSDDGETGVAAPAATRSTGTGANSPGPSAGAATETLSTGDARTTTSGETIPSANPTQEQIAVTEDTLSPAGASSGPTAPRPQN